jgi:predicted nuclease of restriction endonuclease-like (RecB) superfamily
MPKKRSTPKAAAKKSSQTKTLAKRPASVGPSRNEYVSVLTDLTQLIRDSRRRALTTVNRELVCLYWHIGHTIVEQQETAHWGDAVVEQLAADLRAAFPDMKGFSRDNVFRMRQFFLSCRELDRWQKQSLFTDAKVGTAPRLLPEEQALAKKVGAVSRQSSHAEKVGTVSRQLPPLLESTVSAEFGGLILGLSWSQQTIIMGACDRPDERYFYMAMSVRERWSVRELRRQIDAALFERYVSVKRDPEKCLPTDAEHGDLLPFKDHYVLEFLGLEDEHTEKELRKAILGNLRDFFLEFGKDLTFVGEEYPLTVGADTFYIDLLFFHRRLQCLISVDLKIGKFKPEYAGKSQFYCAALDEQLRLSHENPSIGLVLCKTADHAQVRLALTAAARKIGIATYQTVLPDEHLLEQRLARLPMPQEVEP